MSSPPLDLPIRCFSQIANVRCQGLTELQQIVSFIPIACLIFILPYLLHSTWKLPRTTLLLLGIEIILQLGVHAWNLGYYLDRPLLSNFKTTDIALGIASATPILVFLLALTSHLLSDLRTYLPEALQGTPAMMGFAILGAPLIPAGFAGTLLGAFVFVRVQSTRGMIFLDFATVSDDWVNVVLTTLGVIASLAYILLISLLGLIVITHPTSFIAYAPLTRPMILSTTSILLSGVEIALGLIPLELIPPTAAFIIIIGRGVLLLVSRAGIVVGLVWAYKASEPCKKAKINGIIIGGPIRGTFRKMDVDQTMEFYGLHGTGRTGEDGGLIIPIHPSNTSWTQNTNQRAPVLSFTPSAFTSFVGPPLLHNHPSLRQNDSRRPEDVGYVRKTRINLGSIYAPKRVTVDPLTLAQWPPPPPQAVPKALIRPESQTNRPPSLSLPVIVYPEEESDAGIEPLRPRAAVWARETSPSATPASTPKRRKEMVKKNRLDRFSISTFQDRTIGYGEIRDISIPLNPRELISTFTTSPTISPDSPDYSSFTTSASPTSSRGLTSTTPRAGQTPLFTTPIATLSPLPSRSNSIRRKPVPSPESETEITFTFPGVPERTLARRSYPSQNRSRGDYRISKAEVSVEGEEGISSPVSSFDGSGDHRQTLFFATPFSSPENSPIKDHSRVGGESLFPGVPSTDFNEREISWSQEPESATLPTGYTTPTGPISTGVQSEEGLVDQYQEMGAEGIARAATLASLARLRRETGMIIDSDRLSRFSASVGSGGRGSRMSMIGMSDMSVSRPMSGLGLREGDQRLRVRYSSVSSVSDISTPRAKVHDLPIGERAIMWGSSRI